MNLLNDKVAVVTGVSSGIGWAIVNAFIEQGAHVIGVSRREPPPLPNSIEADAFKFLRGDISEKTTLERVAEVAAAARGRIDILVNNAAIPCPLSPIEATTDGDWERILQVNLLGAAKLSARLLPLMRQARYGRIINIGSVLSTHAVAQCGPYVVSKHAVLGLTRSQALEYGPLGITANCLLPGGVDTEMLRGGDTSGAFRRYVESRCPLGRLAAPREIADAAVLLASSLSSYINGHSLVADGGLTVSI